MPLKDYNCVFSIDGEIISLAGVMGGASTACSTKTKKVLVECAYFDPESIIGKSIKYNLISDAAHKFERGVDISLQEMVLRRFVKVAKDHAKIRSLKLRSFTEGSKKSLMIPIDVNKINKILGTSLKNNEYLNHLKGFGFEISNEIKVPSFRHDIKTNNDLAEEIARTIGYNNIKSTPINLKKVFDDKRAIRVKMIESFLCKNGFSEVINFPFTSKKEEQAIIIDNPLDSNKKSMRTEIKDSLVDNMLFNERRQKDSIKLFEISDIYTKNPELNRQKKLGLIISGRVAHNFKQFSNKLDFDYLNNLLNGGIDNSVFEIIEIPRASLNSKRKDKVFYTEVVIDDIKKPFFTNLGVNNKTVNFIKYRKISDFPSSLRDFSFSIESLENVNSVIEILENLADPIIKSVFLFDFYKNDEKNIVKLGYRVTFQSDSKTLSDNEINQKTKEILTPILEMDGVSIPGMHLNII